jgi:hypothetical protein
MAQRRSTSKTPVTNVPLPDEIVVVEEEAVETAPEQHADTDGPAWLITGSAQPEPEEALPAPEIPVVETKVQPHDETPAYRVREGEPKGLILGPDDPVRLTGKDTGTEVIVDQDIFRRVYPRNTKRPTYILLYPKGMKVAKSTLTRVNI